MNLHMNLDRFTDRSRRVLQLAEEEACRLHHEYVGTEHLLLGLIAEDQGVGANVLKHFGISHSEVRREAAAIIQTGPTGIEPDRVVYTPRAMRAIKFAVEESRKLNCNFVGTEHLLLGLACEVEGVAYQILENLGLSARDIREFTLKLLGHCEENIEPTIVPANMTANVASQQLPEPAQAIVVEFARQFELVWQQIESAVSNSDFEKAARLRDLADLLCKLRDDFIRNWKKDV